MSREEGEFEKNVVAFERQLPRLLETDEGRWAVGRAGDEFSCWDSYRDALQHGYNKYALNQFIVKRVLRYEPPQAILSHSLATA